MSTNFILTDEQSSNPDSQLAFDFSSVPETAEKTAGVQLDKVMYADLQAHNAAKMLAENKLTYKMFGVYWWNVKDMLKKHVDNGEWYCGVQDDPLMKERGWHGNEFRTMLAAMYYMNEHQIITSDCVWYDKDGESRNYTLFDPDADC